MTTTHVQQMIKRDFVGFYVVFYEVIGSRCSGSYLVKADNKRHAKQLVRLIDEDYVCRCPVESFIDYTEEMGEDPYEELLNAAGTNNPQEVVVGFTYNLECGT